MYRSLTLNPAINDLLDGILAVPIHNKDGTDRSQIDETTVARLKQIRQEPNKQKRLTGMKSILDDSARYSLSSNFGMVVMDVLYDMMIKEEDGNPEKT